MTEHIAHLDSPNIDHVAVLMHALADRVQFVLATPANAESLRLSWCDLRLAFLGPAPAAHARLRISPVTLSSWRTWPKVKLRSHVPTVEAAITRGRAR